MRRIAVKLYCTLTTQNKKRKLNGLSQKFTFALGFGHIYNRSNTKFRKAECHPDKMIYFNE